MRDQTCSHLRSDIPGGSTCGEVVNGIEGDVSRCYESVVRGQDAEISLAAFAAPVRALHSGKPVDDGAEVAYRSPTVVSCTLASVPCGRYGHPLPLGAAEKVYRSVQEFPVCASRLWEWWNLQAEVGEEVG